MFNTLKKILFPSITDKRVATINADSKQMLQHATVRAKRHNDLLAKNGVTLRIYIATGGDHRVH